MSHSFIRFVQTADSFRNEVNGSLYEWSFESLIHTIRSNGRFIQKLNTALLLGDAQQFCCGFIGNMFSAKLSKTDNNVFIRLHNINFLFTELLYKIIFALMMFGTKTALV